LGVFDAADAGAEEVDGAVDAGLEGEQVGGQGGGGQGGGQGEEGFREGCRAAGDDAGAARGEDVGEAAVVAGVDLEALGEFGAVGRDLGGGCAAQLCRARPRATSSTA
jgi:hypothetical protein